MRRRPRGPGQAISLDRMQFEQEIGRSCRGAPRRYAVVCVAVAVFLLAGACGSDGESSAGSDRIAGIDGGPELSEPAGPPADRDRSDPALGPPSADEDDGPSSSPTVPQEQVPATVDEGSGSGDAVRAGTAEEAVSPEVDPEPAVAGAADAELESESDAAPVEDAPAEPQSDAVAGDAAVDPISSTAAEEGAAADSGGDADQELPAEVDASADRDGVDPTARESEHPDELLDESDSSEAAGGPMFDARAARSGETVVAASFDSTCAVRPDGEVWCWGGSGLPGPPDFSGFDDVVAVSIGDSSAGEFHACALHGDGRVSCWGPGHWGQLGRGNTFSSGVPFEVPGIFDAVGIAAGVAHTCAVHAGGGVSCWGDGSQGQIGDGTTNSAKWSKRVDSLSDVVAISAGSHTNCAIHADGTVSCWGWRAGVVQSTPKKVERLERVVSIAIGWYESCAVRDDGRVFCWPHEQVDMPQEVPGLSGVVAVSVGDRSVCVVHGDGGVSCWGENNTAGQLGDGDDDRPADPSTARRDQCRSGGHGERAIGGWASARLRRAGRRFGVVLGQQRFRAVGRRDDRVPARPDPRAATRPCTPPPPARGHRGSRIRGGSSRGAGSRRRGVGISRRGAGSRHRGVRPRGRARARAG